MALTNYSVQATPRAGVRQPLRSAGLTFSNPVAFGRTYVHDLSDSPISGVTFLSSGDVLFFRSDPLEQMRRQFEAMSLVHSQLAQLRSLPVGWDSYGGQPTDTGPASFAEQLVTALLVQDVQPPAFMPLPGGGLRLEWFGPAAELVIRIPGALDDGSDITAYFSDEETGQEWETDYESARSNDLPDALSRFVGKAL